MGEEKKIFDLLRDAPELSRFQLTVQPQSARPKKSKQKAREAREGRTATMSVHVQQVCLKPPKHHAHKDPIDITVVHLHYSARSYGFNAVIGTTHTPSGLR